MCSREPECLKVMNMLFSWYLRDWLMHPMCHAFSFSISIFFKFPPYIPFLCIWFTLPSPLPCLYLSFITLSPTPYTLSSVFPTVSFSDPTFLLSISLHSCDSTRLLFNPPSHLVLILSSLAVSTPHNYHPTFHGKVPLLFPSFEAISRFFQ